jgi:hypothetical protein
MDEREERREDQHRRGGQQKTDAHAASLAADLRAQTAVESRFTFLTNALRIDEVARGVKP